MMYAGSGMGGEGNIGWFAEYGSTAGFFAFVGCFMEGDLWLARGM